MQIKFGEDGIIEFLFVRSDVALFRVWRPDARWSDNMYNSVLVSEGFKNVTAVFTNPHFQLVVYFELKLHGPLRDQKRLLRSVRRKIAGPVYQACDEAQEEEAYLERFF